jgi:hypothetical protein
MNGDPLVAEQVADRLADVGVLVARQLGPCSTTVTRAPKRRIACPSSSPT